MTVPFHSLSWDPYLTKALDWLIKHISLSEFYRGAVFKIISKLAQLKLSSRGDEKFYCAFLQIALEVLKTVLHFPSYILKPSRFSHMCTERCKLPEETFWFIYCVVFLFCVVLKVRRKTLPLRRESTKTKMISVVI